MRKSSNVLGWVLVATAGGVALAQSAGGDFAITRKVIAGGGTSAESVSETLRADTVRGELSLKPFAGHRSLVNVCRVVQDRR